MERKQNTQLYTKGTQNQVNPLKIFNLYEYFSLLNDKIENNGLVVLDTNIYLYTSLEKILELIRTSNGASLEEVCLKNKLYVDNLIDLIQKNPNIVTNELILKEIMRDRERWMYLFLNGDKVSKNRGQQNLFRDTALKYFQAYKPAIEIAYSRKFKIGSLIKNPNQYYHFIRKVKDLLAETDVYRLHKSTEKDKRILYLCKNVEKDKEILFFTLNLALSKPTLLISRDFDMNILANKLKNSLDLLNGSLSQLSRKKFDISCDLFYTGIDLIYGHKRDTYSISCYTT